MSEGPVAAPHKHAPHQLKARFRAHMRANLTVAFIILAVSLGIGMTGYHQLAGLGWVDSFLNASMLLSGMGPVTPLEDDGAKLFAGLYAIYCGVVFIATVGLVMTPVVSHLLRRFHLNEQP
jgi:hypothetical protein